MLRHSNRGPSTGDARTGGLIDVHAHCLPKSYLDAARATGLSVFDGGFPIPRWDADEAVAFMDRAGIDFQLLSLASPPVHTLADGAQADALAACANEEIAAIVAERPERFGSTAVLPLPNVEGALKAIEYCFGELGVSAVTLFTHYAGVYLGDPMFEPVFAALADWEAVVLLHPTSPVCWEATTLGRPSPVLEFPLDTTRAVTNLLYSGTLQRYPGLRVVVPHAGAAIPALAWRLASFAGDMPMPGRAPGLSPQGILDQIGSLYYDVALSGNEPALAALLSVTDPGHLLYGSDYPFAPEPAVAANTDGLFASEHLDVAALEGVMRTNAVTLLDPPLSSVRHQRLLGEAS
ncbi:amidohydrolase family protein [Streptomyces sp. NPDC048297]|uniref:amidohydrolase family protein n=1 Tax=Streptomyces sp. NPDC048297 TaxID=3365531 RepID=UPI0037133F40